MAKDLFDMTDEEADAAFFAAKEEMASEVNTYGAQEEYEEASEEEEEFDNDLEQSDDSDSDHDSGEDEAEEAEEEDTEESEEDTLDGETEAGEADTTDDATEVKTKPQGIHKLKAKANGQEFEFTPEEVMEQFPKVFAQAMNYTKKLQTIKPWRKTIDAMEQAKLSHEDVSLMIDVFNGDKTAIAEVLKRTSTDALDLDLEGSRYVAKDYGRDESTLALKDIVDEISKDKHFEVTQQVLTSKWDNTSFEEMTKDPKLIQGLHIDIESGMYDIISPIANKLKVYDGAKGTDLDYYKQAARQYYSELSRAKAQESQAETVNRQKAADKESREKIATVKAAEKTRTATKDSSAKRRAAAPTKSRAGGTKVVNYLDDSEEDFDKWYQNTMNSR